MYVYLSGIPKFQKAKNHCHLTLPENMVFRKHVFDDLILMKFQIAYDSSFLSKSFDMLLKKMDLKGIPNFY